MNRPDGGAIPWWLDMIILVAGLALTAFVGVRFWRHSNGKDSDEEQR